MREKLARLSSSQGISQPVAGASPVHASTAAATAYEADAPTAEEVGIGQISPEQQALDEAIERLDIVEAYMRWCKKMVPKFGANQRESIKCSCPNPQHPDKNPSAWMNRDKNTYYCSGCGVGGDQWDIAAYHFGFPVPGYKNDKEMFRQLREKMGTDLGFQVVQGINGPITVSPSATQPAEAEPEEQPAPTVGLTPSGAAHEGTEEERAENQLNAPTIDWRSFIQPDTFLHEYMQACCTDTSPEEYHFWNGLLALGFGIGRDVQLMDRKPVVGNLFVCLTGPSSAGKSRSKAHLDKLLRMTLPYDYDNKVSRGAKIIGSPGSAEYLIFEFQSVDELKMPGTNATTKVYYPVRGLVDFDELSTLMSTATRVGNAIRPQLMSLFDSPLALESGAMSSGRRKAELPFGSVIATTQNRSLRKLLDAGDDGSGFINRWIFAQGKLKQREHIGEGEIDLSAPSAKLKQIHQWAFSGKRLRLSPDADAAWYKFFHETVVPAQDAAERNETAVIARMDLMLKKLFLLFAANRHEEEISLLSVQEAFKLWPYLLKTFGVVSREMKKTESSDLQDEVIKQIDRLHKANKRGPTRRDIYHCVKTKVRNTKDLEELLKTLVKLELIYEIPPVAGTVGRPTVRYHVSA